MKRIPPRHHSPKPVATAARRPAVNGAAGVKHAFEAALRPSSKAGRAINAREMRDIFEHARRHGFSGNEKWAIVVQERKHPEALTSKAYEIFVNLAAKYNLLPPDSSVFTN